MDLQINDVAELLNISEESVRKWISEEKIPSYRIEGEIRINRSELEEWIMQQQIERELPPKGNLQFSLYRALYRGDVLADVPGEGKEQVIRKTMQHMGQNFDLDPDVLTELFLDREQLMSTALGHGIAVPHTRDFLLDTHYDVIMTVYPKHPIDFGALDGEPVHTLFFIFASEDKHHLNLLSKVAHINNNEKNRAFFRTQPSKERLLDFVKHWEGALNG